MKATITLIFCVFATCHTVAGEAPEFLDSGTVLAPGLPFSEAVKVGDTLYLSGQLGMLPKSNKLKPGGIEAEAQQAMDNIRQVLEAHGYGMQDIVKCTVMLADISQWKKFNAVYKTYFAGSYPARSAFGAAGLAQGAQVEVECIAAASDPGGK